MAEKIECPSRAQLEEVMHGKLSSSQMETLAQHVESCPTCEVTLQTLRGDDTFTDLVRKEAKEPDEPPEPVVLELIRQIQHQDEGCGTHAANADAHPALKNSAPTRGDATIATDLEGPTEDEAGAELAFLQKPQAPDEIGRLGHYRILRRLGQGGMGLVFEAEDLKLERRVALKVMKPDIAKNKTHRDRFLREARTAAKVESDYICPIYQVGEENGVPFIAMPFLKGEPLDVRVKTGGKLTIAEIVRIGRETAEGLSAAHEAGLIHRDIKPANIWLETQRSGPPRARILDFGLARAQAEDVQITQSGTVLGTPAYMAPEQGRGDKNVDHRADLFSLGCVLYALSTGEIPFKAETTMGILTALAVHEPPPPSVIARSVPEPLSDLIMQLLSKDAAKRPASAKELIGRFKEIEAALNRTAPSEPRRRSTGGLVFAGIALTCLLGLAGAGVVWLLGGNVFFWQTKDGVVRIEINDPAIQVAFDKQELVFKEGDKQHELRVGPGTFGLHVKKGDLEFDTAQPIVVKRGDLVTLRIEWQKDGKLQVLQGRNVIGEKLAKIDVPPPGAGWVLQFDGEGSYVSVPSLRFDPSHRALTVEAWVEVNSKKASRQGIAGWENVFQLWLEGEGAQSSGAQRVGDKNQRLPRYATENLNRFVGKGPKTIHLAAVWDGKTICLFVDGKKAAKTSELTEIRDPAGFSGLRVDNFALGCNTYLIKNPEGERGGFFKGTFQEVRVSKVPRYTTDFTPQRRFEPDKDTLALYHMDEGSGDTLKDSSGNGHHGKIVGAKWAKADGTPVAPPAIAQGKYALSFAKKGRVSVPSLKPDPSRPLTVEGYFTQLADAQLNSFLYTYGGIYLSGGKTWSLSVLESKEIVSATSVVPLQLGKRTHVAGVFTGRRLLLFVDGELAVSQDYDSSNLRKPVFPHFSIGSEGDGSFCTGRIEEVRVSSTARYAKNFTPIKRFEPDADTLALYHFDEGAGEVLKDSSG